MRWLKVGFDAWGGFDGVELDFSADAPGLQIIHGPNEAGKSTSMRGLKALLFGIPTKTADSHRHKYTDLRLRAEIKDSDGEVLAFVRRKGTKNTLLDLEGVPMPETRLARLLDGVAEDAYAQVFSMDHPNLVEGGKAIAGGGGRAPEILFQAGSGMTHLRRIMKQLDAEASSLYKERGRKDPVSRALHEAREARKRAVECSIKPREWEQMEKDRDDLRERVGRLDDQLRAVESRLRDVERSRQAHPHAARRRSALAELETMRGVRLLDEEARSVRIEIERAEERARLEAESAKRRCLGLGAELKELEVPEDLLAAADVVREHVAGLQRYREALRERPACEASIKESKRAAAELLGRLKPGAKLGEAGALRVSSSERSEIERLIVERARLEEMRAALKKRASHLARQEKGLKSSGSTDGVSESLMGELRSLSRKLERKIDGEAEMEAWTAEHAEVGESIRQRLTRLSKWSGTIEGVANVCVPGVELVDEFESRETDSKQRKSQLMEDVARVESELLQAKEALDRLRDVGELPSVGDLEAIREVRAERWGKLKRQGEDGERWDPEAAGRFEAAVSSADEVADRLRQEAQKVEQVAAASAREQKCLEQLKLHEEEGKRLQSLDEAWRREWAEAWRPAGVEPDSPRVMRSWLAKFHAIQQEASAWLGGQARWAKVGETLQELKREVAQTLESRKLSFPPGATLRDLLDVVRVELDAMELSARKSDQLAADRDRLAEEREDHAADTESLNQESDAWSERWDRAISKWGFTAAAEASEVKQGLADWDQLAQQIDIGSSARSRTEQLDRAITDFEGEVSELRSLLPEEERDLPVEIVVRRLEELVRQAEINAKRREDLQKRWESERAHGEQAAEVAAEQQAKLQTLMERAGCQRLSELPEAEERSGRLRQLRRTVEESEDELRRLKPGIAPLVFAESVEREDETTLEDLWQELETERLRLDDVRVTVRKDLEVLEQRMRASDGSDAAARAMEDAEAFMAEAESGAERYAHLRLAEFFLRRHTEQYLEANQGPVIGLGSSIFSRLTLGRYSRIVPDFNDRDEPILRAERADGSVVDVEGLSDGTRDQMFLALRLASLEQRLDEGRSFPLVVDDLLLTFDDERAAAALSELARLGERTQVLFFTHHQHLVDIAGSALGASAWGLQELVP